ncbi:MAG: tetratricopeptide repeat protein [candidate division NC10 bacterium]|nr:tetratricopeptide repeat protein [candidate division NC10 bacterium]
MQMTEQQRLEHNQTFEEASALIKNEIPLHERPNMPVPGWLLRRKLKRALFLFERVLQLNPENWSAMWLVGKVHQRFGDYTAALSWFERAYQVNPSQPDIAREASMCAMGVGRHDAAIVFAHRATQIEPASAGLHANLALAYLLAGRITDAQASIERSIAADQTDKISKTIKAIIQHFATNGHIPPTTTQALQDYWRNNPTA